MFDSFQGNKAVLNLFTMRIFFYRLFQKLGKSHIWLTVCEPRRLISPFPKQEGPVDQRREKRAEFEVMEVFFDS